jgi:hypothetical protein
VRLVLSHGANPNIADEDDNSPATIARKMNQWKTAEFLKAQDNYNKPEGVTTN